MMSADNVTNGIMLDKGNFNVYTVQRVLNGVDYTIAVGDAIYAIQKASENAPIIWLPANWEGISQKGSPVVMILKDFSIALDDSLSTEEKAGGIAVNTTAWVLMKAGGQLVSSTPVGKAIYGLVTLGAIIGLNSYLSGEEGKKIIFDVGNGICEFGSNITDGVSNIVDLFEVAEKSTEKIYDGYGDGIEVTTYEIRLSESGIQMFDNIVNGVNDFVAQMNELTSVIPDNADLANNEQLRERIKGALEKYGISEDEAQKIIDSPNMFSNNFALGDLFEKALNCISSVAYAAADIQKCSTQTISLNGTKAIRPYTLAENLASPVTLDLNGDGIITSYVLDNYVNFDLNADGFAERTGWISAEDGLLVRDINGNGIIDNGRELFGNYTMLKSGRNAFNGYEALAA